MRTSRGVASHFALAVCVCVPVRHSAQAQQAIPVVDLPPASARTTESLGFVLGVRQLAGGRILVNDAGRRQMRVFDSTLATSTIVRDSTPGLADSYGMFIAPLLAYGADSALFPDVQSHTLLVLDGRGRGLRSWALPGDPEAMNSLRSGHSAVDNKARLIYASGAQAQNRRYMARDTAFLDTLELVRADLDTRRIDTIGRFVGPGRARLHLVSNADGSRRMRAAYSPLQTVDEWAVLSDGTIGFVRGHDYHIDWILPDGTRSSTGKLPFDWRRLTDEDKQKLIDSVRAIQDSAAARFARLQAASAGPVASGAQAKGGTSEAPVAQPAGLLRIDVETARPDEIPDYYPPIRTNALIPDLDGNLWILPTTSAQTRNGEVIYDVVNPTRGLCERVRLPAGRTIAGFGRGGVVYLVSGDRTTGLYLERSVLGPH
jgi:hypothetical protein